MAFKIKSNTSIIILALYAFFTLVNIFIISNNSQLKAAALGWTQGDWSLGADINAIANATLNQTGWQKFYSKTANVDVSTPGQIKLSDPDSSIIQTSDADFNGGTVDSYTYVANGSVNLRKQNGRACTSNNECASVWCSGNVCAVSPWISGVCAGIGVWNVDSGSLQWHTDASACISPQCSNGVLVADNSVDFSAYAARNACKNIGGRLPTRTELSCIYTNRASLGNNFQVYYYLTGEESGANAYNVDFSGGGNIGGDWKYNAYYVRCVKTQ